MEKEYDNILIDGREFFREKILKKFCENYYAVYLLFPEKNLVAEFTLSQTDEELVKFHKMDEALCYWLENNVSPDYRPLFEKYIGGPEKNENIFSIDKNYDMVFRSISGQSFSASYCPIEQKEFLRARAILVTIKEIASVKNEVYEINSRKKFFIDNYVRLFIDSARDLYEDIYKYDFDKEEVVKIEIKDNNINEIHYKNLWESYKEIFKKYNLQENDASCIFLTPEQIQKMSCGEEKEVSIKKKKSDGEVFSYLFKVRMGGGCDNFVSVSEEGREENYQYFYEDKKVATIFISGKISR